MRLNKSAVNYKNIQPLVLSTNDMGFIVYDRIYLLPRKIMVSDAFVTP